MGLIEQVQYKAALIVSGCWQGTNRDKLYEELGWETLSRRRWHRRMTTYYKINNGLTPSYLNEHIPEQVEPTVSLRRHAVRTPLCRTNRFANSFFPFCSSEWNSLDDAIKSSPSLSEFKAKLNSQIRPKGNSFHSIRDSSGIKLLTKIRVTFSDLRDHRFNHNFNCTSPLCHCGLDEETSIHYFLCCPRYTDLRALYLSKICEIIGSDVTILPSEHLFFILLCGSNIYNDVTNEGIISETIHYIKSSGRFKMLEAFS